MVNNGFSNNVNVIQVRVNGAHSQTLTDRAIDLDGDGAKEKVTLTHVSGHAVGTPSAPGGVTRTTVNAPAGITHSVVKDKVETDLGISGISDEFTEGCE